MKKMVKLHPRGRKNNEKLVSLNYYPLNITLTMILNNTNHDTYFFLLLMNHVSGTRWTYN